MSDSFFTILQPSTEILFKEKNSKFFGYSFPFEKEGQLKPILEQLKKQHSQAGHLCFAYQIGSETIYYRTNDDGEPKNTAGLPIYGQIQSKNVTNIIVIVVRYFGGTKLGVSGLISAYKETAKLTLDAAKITQKFVTQNIQLNFDYSLLNKVMRIIKSNDCKIISQKMEETCELIISIKKTTLSENQIAFESIFGIQFKPI